MQKRRILVISVDALFAEDKAYLETKENIGAWLKGASGCVNTRSVYPTVTYPNHVAMATGAYPERNGIHTNYMFTLTGDGHNHWYWDSRHIKVDTIFSAAKKAGYTTACGFWPVTCYNKDIDYNIPEYWLSHDEDTIENCFPAMGSSPEMMEIIQANRKYLRSGVEHNIDCQPEYDDFIVHCDCDIIRKYKPEVFLTHWCVVDDFRHRFGIDHRAAKEAMDHVDRFFGLMVQALKDAGVYDETDIFIISDHGQMDCQRKIRVNKFFVDKGFITLDENGQVKDYKALIIPDGFSAQVYLKNKDNAEDYQEVYDYLKYMVDIGIFGIGEVLTKQEAIDRYHLNGAFDFVVESDGYTSTVDGFTGSYVLREDRTRTPDHRHGKGNHGFMPDKGPKPMFWCKGPHIVPDVWLEEHCVVDEAPTYAVLLGAELPEAQGKPMLELLK